MQQTQALPVSRKSTPDYNAGCLGLLLLIAAVHQGLETVEELAAVHLQDMDVVRFEHVALLRDSM